ncbi:MAG: IPT/TIG domain-containing protein [Pseudomonadota bacterium]
MFYTDLTSGPNSGGENNKGAFVTIYGANLGAIQGASTVRFGGGFVDHCSVWGVAWLWFQKITCQLGANAATGNIVVTVSGQVSNTLPFTVRSGNIYFVSTSGSNANPGTFAAPYRDIWKAKNTMPAGSILYVRGGLWSDVEPPTGSAPDAITMLPSIWGFARAGRARHPCPNP